MMIPVPPGDVLAAINAANLRAHWTHTLGLGFQNSNSVWRRPGNRLWLPAQSAGVFDSAAWAKRHLLRRHAGDLSSQANAVAFQIYASVLGRERQKQQAEQMQKAEGRRQMDDD